MQSLMHSLIAHFSLHPGQALAAVFAASVLEAFAVIGSFVPGSSVVFAAGTLIGLGALGPWPVAATAVIGAILGDGASYWLGQHYHARLQSVWPLKKHPQLIERGQAYFAAHGRASVFFGRLLAPTRAIIPVIAGMSDMPPAQFYVMNLLSAIAWAALHLLPGMLFGASLNLAGAISSRLLVLLVAAALLLWGLSVLLKFLYQRLWPRARELRDGLVGWARGRSGLLARVIVSLLDPHSAESPGLLFAAMLLLGGAWLFLGTLEDVVSKDPLVVLDQAVYTTLQGMRTEWVDQLMVAVTEIGSAGVAIPMIAAASIVFAMARCWRTLGYWLTAMVFAQALVWVLKLALERARPALLYSGLDQFSFPSGHAASSIVLYGLLAFLLARGKSPGMKISIGSAATVVVLLISFSRLYLGAHWFSDVLASLAFGLAWVALLSIAYTTHVRRETIPAGALAIAAAATMAVAGWLWVATHHASDLARYAPRRTQIAVELVHWQEGAWRSLPARRTEIEGEVGEPLSLQWAGAADEISQVLHAAGWATPPKWNARALLAWLLPHPDIAGLPVVPKFDRGLSPDLTFMKVRGPAQRFVLRMWRSGYATGVHGKQEQIWMATVSTETRKRMGGVLTVLATTQGPPAALDTLATSLAPDSMQRAVRADGSPVLLVW